MQSSTVEAAHHRRAKPVAVPRQGGDGAVRARVRAYAGQRAAARAALVDARLRAHRSQDHRRAARVLGAGRRAGRRRRHPAESQGRGAQAAQPRPRAAEAREEGRRRRHGGRHRAEPRRRDHQSRPRDRAPDGRRQARNGDQGREGPRLPARDGAHQAGRRPHDRQHPARRVVLARSAASATRSSRRASNSAPTWTSWCSTSRPTASSSRSRRCATRRSMLVEQLSVFADLKGTDTPSAERAIAAGRSDPAASGRRSGTHGAFGQLPEGREHLLHRRPDPAHRNRAAEDAEPGPQVAERDQGSARVARPVARHEARELAAGGPGYVRKGERARTNKETSCVTVTACGSSTAPAAIASRCCAT